MHAHCTLHTCLLSLCSLHFSSNRVVCKQTNIYYAPIDPADIGFATKTTKIEHRGIGNIKRVTTEIVFGESVSMFNQFTRYSWQKTYVQLFTIDIKLNYLCTHLNRIWCIVYTETGDWAEANGICRNIYIHNARLGTFAFYLTAYTKPACLLNHWHMKAPTIQTTQKPYKVFMVTNSICLCYLKWIFRWPKRNFSGFSFYFRMSALCDTDMSEVKWWKMPRFSFWNVVRAYTSFENSRICHRNSMEKHAKCSSCKLIYGHARQQCKSIHQSSRTYLFKWVRRNETWITLDRLCSTSIWMKRTLVFRYCCCLCWILKGFDLKWRVFSWMSIIFFHVDHLNQYFLLNSYRFETILFTNWHLNVGNLDYVLSLVSHFDNIPIHFQMAKTYKICDYNRSQYVGVHGGFSQTFVRILNRMNECISIQLKSMKWLHFYDHSFRMEWNGRKYELHVDVQIADFWR